MSATADRTWVPVPRFVPSWPSGVLTAPPLDDVGVVAFTNSSTDGALTVSCTLAFAADLAFGLPGVDGVELLLLSDGEDTRVTAEAVISTDLTVSLSDLKASVRFPGGFLTPVMRADPSSPWQPIVGAELVATFDVGVATVDGGGRITLEPEPALSLDPFMVGDTGIVIEADGVRLALSDATPPPLGQSPGFRGVSIDTAALYLPPAFAVPLAPDAISATGLVIGGGGVSGTLSGVWAPSWAGTTPSGEGAGTLAGLAFGLESLSVELTQNAITGASLAGRLAVPFFDQVLGVDAAIGMDGSVTLDVGADDDVAELSLPGLGTLSVAAIGLVSDDEGEGLLVSGDLQPEVGAPALVWPLITVEGLRIAADGTITLPGGWMTLQTPVALDLYGFALEITRVGFGTEADGRRWFGVDGSVRLTDLLPAGASARGLRAIWDPARPDTLPTLALDGIGVFFGIPDAFGFEGEVALTDDPATGAKIFTGQLSLGLDALDVGVDAGIEIGHATAGTYVFVDLGVDVPIPVAATGTALYGLEGLFAMNMSPSATGGVVVVDADTTIKRGDWYGWYKSVPDAFSVTDREKWSVDVGNWAFGAGLSLGTLPDAGFSMNTKALLVVLLPGPVILLQGTADILKAPAAFGAGATDEGTFSLLAALDGRAGTLELGLDAVWSVPMLLDIAVSTEAFFDFDRSDAWHVWLGRDQPESMRVRADVLSLFHADAWLMLGADGIGTGLDVSWDDSWKFGPVTLSLSSSIGAGAALSERPSQLAGALDLTGEAAIAVGPFGTGLNVAAELAAASPSPFDVSGTLSVTLELPPPLKDLDIDIGLEWSRPQTPSVQDPWESVVAAHERSTESWTPIPSGAEDPPDDDAPVVPLDALVLVTFEKPMGDEQPVTDNPPTAPPSEAIGAYQASYALTQARLRRWRRSHPEEGWQDVTDTVVATWTPDAGGAGSRLQLFARSPLAFTRSTSRRWSDSLVDAQPGWPCAAPPSVEPTCIDWRDLKVDDVLPQISARGGATLSTEAELVVAHSSSGTGIRLGASSGRDGAAQPGLLWIGLPAPAAEVTAVVDVPLGELVVLRALRGPDQVAVDWGSPGTATLHCAATGIDALTIGWGLRVESVLVRVCWTPQAAQDAVDAWTASQSGLDVAASRWSSDEPVLEPETHYLLELDTRALLTLDGSEIQRVEKVHAVQFQTGGPPGIVPSWVAQPRPQAATFPYGGVLRDLAPYVSRTIPDPGAVPVARAYDLGCEFDATTVQQMYGADLTIHVRDHNGRPALDAAGEELALDNEWVQSPTTTLTSSEATWLARLDACTGAVDWLGLAGDQQVRSQAPGLLYDDFSGTLASAWTPYVLDAAETQTADWHLDGGVLRQDVVLAGTAYVSDDVDVADVALDALGWASSGEFGVVFRWQGAADHYRFSIGRRRSRLVRVRGGVSVELWSQPIAYEPGVPTWLVVQAQGARIRCQIGERLVCDLDEAGLTTAPSGSVGLYSADGDSAAFDEVRARPWPGNALAPARAYTAELFATRPLFTDAFDDLGAFEPVTLSSGAAVSTCSAGGGVAVIARPRGDDAPVAALAGDPTASDYVVECTARPDAGGTFGLVARHAGPGQYLALQLVPGGGRSLIASTPAAGPLSTVRVLWHDAGDVEVGAIYALALRCEGTTVTISIDGEEHAASTTLTGGRFGLLSGIPKPGCAFTDLVVRSAPAAAVHHWEFVTSRYLGLPDLLDIFTGEVWPLPAAADPAELADQATTGAARMAAAAQAVDAARAELATAVAAADAVELAPLGDAARAAVAAMQQESSSVHDLLVGSLGTPWRPSPPIVELSSVAAGKDVIALLLDLPEPLPWERMDWSLLAPDAADDEPLADLVLAWSADGSHAVLVRTDGQAFAAGPWTLNLALRLDVGAERATWRRGGSSVAEAGALRFALDGDDGFRGWRRAQP